MPLGSDKSLLPLQEDVFCLERRDPDSFWSPLYLQPVRYFHLLLLPSSFSSGACFASAFVKTAARQAAQPRTASGICDKKIPSFSCVFRLLKSAIRNPQFCPLSSVLYRLTPNYLFLNPQSAIRNFILCPLPSDFRPPTSDLYLFALCSMPRASNS